MEPPILALLWLIILSISICAVLFGIVYLRNRENMAMIERGMPPRDKGKNQPKPFISLKFGALLFGAGLGLFVSFLIDTYSIGRTHNDSLPALYFGLIAIGAGLGLLSSYRLEMKYWNKSNDAKSEM